MTKLEWTFAGLCVSRSTWSHFGPPHFAVSAPRYFRNPSERQVLSVCGVLLNKNYVSYREAGFAFLPLRSVLKVLQILPFPSDPELIGQVLCPPPPVPICRSHTPLKWRVKYPPATLFCYKRLDSCLVHPRKCLFQLWFHPTMLVPRSHLGFVTDPRMAKTVAVRRWTSWRP